MFTYPGYVTVNIFRGLLNHNCNGKEEVKKKKNFLIRNTHTQSKINPISWDVGESVLGFTTFTSRRLVCSESVGQEPSLRGGELDENSILGRTPRPNFTRIGPLQLVIYVVKNRHAGEQKSH